MNQFCFYDYKDEHLFIAKSDSIENAYGIIATNHPEFLKHSHEYWTSNIVETDDFEHDTFHHFVFRFEDVDSTIHISARSVLQAIKKINQRHFMTLHSRKYKVYTPKNVSIFMQETIKKPIK